MKTIDNLDNKPIEIIIGFDVNTEEIIYIKSDFFSTNFAFKDPVDYTARLLEMALDKYVRENIGVFCPECSEEINENWTFCPNCGWKNE